MPGEIGTDLPIQDNSDMVEDNIEITGMDDPVDSYDHEEPKIDLNVPSENPILPQNPEEPIGGTEPIYKTSTKTFEVPTIKPTINKAPTIEKLKECTK
jgi:hypothetical protein